MIYMFFGVPNWISHQPTLERIESSHSDAAKARLRTATAIFADAGLQILLDATLRTSLHEEWRQEKSLDHQWFQHRAVRVSHLIGRRRRQ